MRRLLIAAVIATAVLGIVVAAQGEVYQRGNLRVTFDGRLRPHDLPRERPAPVTVSLDGTVGTVDGSRPPQLREITVAMNRAGKVFATGLPTCEASRLHQTSTEAALRLCRPALVGHGTFAAKVDSSNAPLIPARGKVLVFNSRIDGKQGMLLHLYGSVPVRAAFVLPFEIKRLSKGEFGTVFSTRIPTLAADLGYVTEINLTIGRRYRYAGKPRSFLSASCAAPAGFSGGPYQLAKTTFAFSDGTSLTSRLTRDCTVRKP
jgi:hypothetical protein